MTPLSVPAEAVVYEMAVIALYVDLPETPRRASAGDQLQARRFFERRVPLPVIETALLLGSLRRLQRPAAAPRLPPIRSLAYFQPVVEELLQAPVSDSYRAYLQRQMQPYLQASAAPQTGS
jgi:hypothetical protein